MDHIRDSFGSVGNGIDDWLHDGWSHSCPAGHRHHRGADPSHSRTKTSVTIWILGGQGDVFTERSNCYEKEKYRYPLFFPCYADGCLCGLCIDIQTGKQR